MLLWSEASRLSIPVLKPDSASVYDCMGTDAGYTSIAALPPLRVISVRTEYWG